jgi:mannosyltransferase
VSEAATLRGQRPAPRPPDLSERSTWAGPLLLLVGAITAAGLLLRLPSFNDALFGDELSTYFIVAGNGLGDVMNLVRSDQEVSPPLYFLLSSATEGLGDRAESLRLTSLFAGTAAIPLTYLLGQRTVGRGAALVGAALVALSPFLIFFSTEARPYALVLLLGLLSTLALLRALDTRRSGWWIAYAACSLAAVYTHYTVVFLLVGQFAWALWTRPEARRALVATNVGVAAGFLPWLPGFLEDSDGPSFIAPLEPFGLEAVKTDLGHWWIGHPYAALGWLPGDAALALVVAGMALGLLGLALGARAARGGARWPPSNGSVLVLVLAVATPVGAALYSSIGDTVWQSKNLIVSWPGLALVVGALVTSARGPLRVAAVTLVLGAFAIGAVKMLDSDSQRPDYEAAAEYIDHVGVSGEPVVEAPIYANPLTSLDVTLKEVGESSQRHPVLRVDAPPLRSQLRARRRLGDDYLFAPLPVPSPQVVARRAARLARGGDMFVAGLGSAPPARVRRTPESPLAAFLRALPSRFRHVETKTFPGYSIFSVSVYVFRDRRAAERI